ncbi:hypothetical protein F5Y14DRAFT_421173 [Nemania sp. NC0429]|nr:hypothetical protein F5Y14DRAFT_421173 [Nemania sp. NC0429]
MSVKKFLIYIDGCSILPVLSLLIITQGSCVVTGTIVSKTSSSRIFLFVLFGFVSCNAFSLHMSLRYRRLLIKF